MDRGDEMTIEEIAKMAGVSRTAVSRYLNNGYISEEKKEKISRIIEKTGYQPSRQAQMLRTKKTKLIGVVLPKINSEAISRIVAGISAIVTKEGFQILLANTENNLQKELEYLNLFQNNQVDGIIFIATILSKEHKRILSLMKLPIVVVGQHSETASCIFHDDFHASKDLTDMMIESGKKHIGYIGVTQRDKAAGLDRKRGYLESLKSHGLSAEESWMLESEFSMESGFQKMALLLKTAPLIDGVFCATDSIAIGAMNQIKLQGKKIPEEIALVGIGHTQMSEVVTPRLTTAHYYYKTSGLEAAAMILHMIQEETAIRKELKLGYHIVKQESTF